MKICGDLCTCELEDHAIKVSGEYYLYNNHKRQRYKGTVEADIKDIMRIGMTKTYSRDALAFPMILGIATLIIKKFPKIEIDYDIIPIFFSVGHTFWELPYQDILWAFCAMAFVIALICYRLSYRTDLEINTVKGRFLLPCKGAEIEEILLFQKAFYQKKRNYENMFKVS